MIKKCLFPAAGYGTRFLPATKATPKEMLPILTKPLIQYGVEEAIEAGCDTMAIVTGRGKRAIEDHFDISYELEHQIKGTDKEHYLTEIREVIERCTFSYTRQVEMKGLGHAILSGESLIGNNPFAVILADDLCDNPRHPKIADQVRNDDGCHAKVADQVRNDDGCHPELDSGSQSVLSQMVKLYEKYKCSIVAIEEVPKEHTNKYGIIEGNQIEEGLFILKNMVEKPDPKDAPSNLAIIGRYILTPDIFDLIRQTKPGKGGEIQITDALLKQAQEGMVLGYKFEGKRFDCGSIEGYVEATNYFYEKENNSQKLHLKQR